MIFIYPISLLNYGWQSKERNSKDREAGGHDLSNPSFRNSVAVPDGGDGDLKHGMREEGEDSELTESYHAPPQSISVTVEILPPSRSDHIFLTEVDKVAGEDESQEANVEGRDQLLSVDINNRAQQSPGPALSIFAEARFIIHLFFLSIMLY